MGYVNTMLTQFLNSFVLRRRSDAAQTHALAGCSVSTGDPSDAGAHYLRQPQEVNRIHAGARLARVVAWCVLHYTHACHITCRSRLPPSPAVFLNIALEMPLGLQGLCILTIDLITEQVCLPHELPLAAFTY